eukprot:3238368-Amphidinium_carterae.1
MRSSGMLGSAPLDELSRAEFSSVEVELGSVEVERLVELNAAQCSSVYLRLVEYLGNFHQTKVIAAQL